MGRQHDWRWVEVLLVTVVMSAARSGTVGLVFALGHMTIVCGAQEKEVSMADMTRSKYASSLYRLTNRAYKC